MGTAGPRAGRCRGGPRPAPAMDDLDALLADLETTSCHLGRHPVLLPQAPAGPPDPPAGTPGTPGDPPRPPPPPCGPAPSGAPPAGGDTEQLYSTVHKARPPRGPPRSPTAPGLGELDRLLRDLDVTHCSIADEILAQFPPLKGPDGEKKAEEEEEEAEDGASPPRPSTPGPPPAPPSASSATQELDRLMASLSDFRLRSTPPPQQPAPGSLDSMLVLLQSDLSRRGVPTGSKGVCGACRKPIAGQVVTALGCAWHPEHFVCAHCQRALGGSTFFEKDGAPYCERDYFQLFAPRCGQCAQPILDKMVTALDKNWHPEHFCCVKCGRPFGEEAPRRPHGVPTAGPRRLPGEGRPAVLPAGLRRALRQPLPGLRAAHPGGLRGRPRGSLAPRVLRLRGVPGALRGGHLLRGRGAALLRAARGRGPGPGVPGLRGAHRRPLRHRHGPALPPRALRLRLLPPAPGQGALPGAGGQGLLPALLPTPLRVTGRGGAPRRRGAPHGSPPPPPTRPGTSHGSCLQPAWSPLGFDVVV
ncbi:transforming growth factor beta-1-induced transcript 1 protein isoform X1 [Dromaius novaehollandiae]|uniref:transforming growth factor beta-1-induced transcript 1 protein isoform X1 n=1 Tax=Dromaius novaehollandiae TaxID=8790 RepID=UPI00311F8AF0